MKNKKHLILVFFLSLLTCWRLFRPGFFSMQDDMQIFRLHQFDRCLQDGQIPCRYIPDGGLGYGYPLFNYYPPAVYAIAEIFHLLGFSLITSIKLVFVLGHILAGLGMFALTSLLWGNTAGLLSAALYLFAPYRALDSYVRGALAEFFALSLIPWVFYFFHRRQKIPAVLSLTLLLLTHNLYGLIAFGLIFAYLIILRRYRLLPLPIFSLLLASSFLLPAILEANLVTLSTMTQGYFDFKAHFVSLYQLFIDRSWGYGASLWGPQDDMSFQIGYLHWLLPLLTLTTLLVKKKLSLLTIFLFSVGLISLFLTHNKSTFIWLNLPFMAYFQFPWRFLGLAVFCFSFLSGQLTKFIPPPAVFLLIIVIAILNLGYFKEDIWFSHLTDQQKLTSPNFINQSGMGLKDYWPKFGRNFPTQFAPSQPWSDQNITINQFSKNSRQVTAGLVVNSSSATVTLPLVYFPSWRSNKSFSIEPNLGLIQFNLPQGQHQINLQFQNTPIRTIANLISLLSLPAFLIYVKKTK